MKRRRRRRGNRRLQLDSGSGERWGTLSRSSSWACDQTPPPHVPGGWQLVANWKQTARLHRNRQPPVSFVPSTSNTGTGEKHTFATNSGSLHSLYISRFAPLFFWTQSAQRAWHCAEAWTCISMITAGSQYGYNRIIDCHDPTVRAALSFKGSFQFVILIVLFNHF